MIRRPPRSTLFPYTTALPIYCATHFLDRWIEEGRGGEPCLISDAETLSYADLQHRVNRICNVLVGQLGFVPGNRDRKSTRLNSSHANISYAVFCLKKKYSRIV